MTDDFEHSHDGDDHDDTLGKGPDLSGRTLGQYRLIRRLAEGGMSQVYLADQIDMERWAAVKVLQIASPTLRSRFRNEVKAVSRLGQHPNIVSVFNFGELTDGVMYLAMEYVDGRDLSRLATKERVSPIRAIEISIQIASALQFAHDQGVIHRDLKPQNIMITRATGSDALKVLDFGLAVIGEPQTGHTPAGVVVGTPQYLSPEQCMGKPATPVSDQYSFGLVFFELLTGQPAYRSDTVVGYLRAHTEGRIPAPSSLNRTPGIAHFDAIVQRMVEKDPRKRYPDLNTLIQELDALRGRIPGRDAPSGRPSPAPSGPATTDEAPTRSEIKFSVAMEGPLPVADLGRDELLRRGFRIVAGEQPQDASYRVVVSDGSNWRNILKSRSTPAESDEASITCIDAPPSSLDAVAAIEHSANTIIGEHPLAPVVLEAGLWWLRSPNGNMIDNLARMSQVATEYIVHEDDKSRCADRLIADLKTAGVRSSVRRAAKAVVEEMALNALIHAPVRGSATRPNEQMADGKEAVLRWFIGDDFIGLSIRDSFGSLRAPDIQLSKSRSRNKGERKPRGDNAGLGLEIMARSANHLIYMVAPGAFSEVVALLRTDGTSANNESTLSMLTFTPSERQIGDRLWLRRESREGGLCLTVNGEINETSDLSAIYNETGYTTLDFGGVTAINSRGVVAWYRAVETRNPALRLQIENCAPAIVQQLNMMQGLAQPAEVASILLPYECQDCRHESTEKLILDGRTVDIEEHLPCAECGGTREFEELPEQYLEFLS